MWINMYMQYLQWLLSQITVKLDLKRNNLGQLPKSAFKHTPYLTHLNLQGCSIHSVREGAFRGLSRLVQLDLTSNNIDILYQVFSLRCGSVFILDEWR